jgi:hypothetical protein
MDFKIRPHSLQTFVFLKVLKPYVVILFVILLIMPCKIEAKTAADQQSNQAETVQQPSMPQLEDTDSVVQT